MIDNPMATGRFPYDENFVPTDYFCPRCKTPLDYEAFVYEWGEDWICGDCLVDAVHSLSKEDRADITGYSITFTERHFELYRGDAREYAHFLGITTNRVEDIA